MLVQKAWAAFFKKRMEKEMQKYAAIEGAFQKIRSATGNSDVKEMVQKFMTKEQTYSHLLQAVGQGEKKYDELKEQNEIKKKRLQELKIENDNRKNMEKPDAADEREMEAFQMQMSRIEESKDGAQNEEAEFAKLTRELDELNEMMEGIKERKKKIQLISDQVGGWTQRVATKMSEQLSETGIPIKTEDKSFVEIYKNINELVVDQLEIIRHDQAARARENEEEEDEKESINGKDYMNDFATEEFVTKNIRVMPMAGASIHGDRESEHQSRHMMGGEISDQEDNKFNIEANHEIQDVRENVKTAK